VKLLLDENLSDKIVARISDLFPDCTHVKGVALMQAEDAAVADWARHHGFFAPRNHLNITIRRFARDLARSIALLLN
jgi:hypothetical protein